MIKKTLKINGVERILILDKDETLAQVLREHLLTYVFRMDHDRLPYPSDL